MVCTGGCSTCCSEQHWKVSSGSRSVAIVSNLSGLLTELTSLCREVVWDVLDVVAHVAVTDVERCLVQDPWCSISIFGGGVLAVAALCMEVQVHFSSLLLTAVYKMAFFSYFFQLSSKHNPVYFKSAIIMVNPTNPAPNITNSHSCSTTPHHPSTFQSMIVMPMVDPDHPPYYHPSSGPGETSELWRI